MIHTQVKGHLHRPINIYFKKQTKDPKVTNMSHSNESVLNTKRTVRYTNKLIKKTTDTKLQKILAVNKKSNTG